MTDPIRKRSDNFTETEVDGEVVVMHLSTGDFYSLTGTGRAIWRLIDGTRDRTAVLAALESAYGSDAASISTDVDEFLSQMRSAGLIGDA